MRSTPAEKRRLLVIAGTMATLVAVTLFAAMPKRIFWNASASIPIGLYWAASPTNLGFGDIVIFDPPAGIARFADQRGYLPAGTPMLKRVAGLVGDRVCRHGTEVRIGTHVVAARPHDRQGRLLPTWEGCRMLRPGEVFLLNANVPDSLDGRYFGPQPVDRILAIAIPVWTFGDPE
jgi:conjugative transfer signal peptidase TraF